MATAFTFYKQGERLWQISVLIKSDAQAREPRVLWPELVIGKADRWRTSLIA